MTKYKKRDILNEWCKCVWIWHKLTGTWFLKVCVLVKIKKVHRFGRLGIELCINLSSNKCWFMLANSCLKTGSKIRINVNYAAANNPPPARGCISIPCRLDSFYALLCSVQLCHIRLDCKGCWSWCLDIFLLKSLLKCSTCSLRYDDDYGSSGNMWFAFLAFRLKWCLFNWSWWHTRDIDDSQR